MGNSNWLNSGGLIFRKCSHEVSRGAALKCPRHPDDLLIGEAGSHFHFREGRRGMRTMRRYNRTNAIHNQKINNLKSSAV